jgi:hypothetical protein
MEGVQRCIIDADTIADGAPVVLLDVEGKKLPPPPRIGDESEEESSAA